MALKSVMARGLALIGSAERLFAKANQKDLYQVQKNLLIKKIDDFDLTADLYIPNAPGLKPAVLVVHGGGWENRSGEMHNVSQCLAEAGYVVLNTTYRLSPQHAYPKPVDDIRIALSWLKANASQFDVDVTKISAWGYSAGAHLILLAGLDGKAGFKSLIAGGTPSDLTVWPRSTLVRQLLGVDFKKNPALWKEASPVNHITDQTPPVFLYHGEWDLMVTPSQMTKLEKALIAKNRVVETYTAKQMGHLSVYLLSRKSIDLGISFLKRN